MDSDFNQNHQEKIRHLQQGILRRDKTTMFTTNLILGSLLLLVHCRSAVSRKVDCTERCCLFVENVPGKLKNLRVLFQDIKGYYVSTSLPREAQQCKIQTIFCTCCEDISEIATRECFGGLFYECAKIKDRFNVLFRKTMMIWSRCYWMTECSRTSR